MTDEHKASKMASHWHTLLNGGPKCCDTHGDCNQGRTCPLRPARPKPSGWSSQELAKLMATGYDWKKNVRRSPFVVGAIVLIWFGGLLFLIV